MEEVDFQLRKISGKTVVGRIEAGGGCGGTATKVWEVWGRRRGIDRVNFTHRRLIKVRGKPL